MNVPDQPRTTGVPAWVILLIVALVIVGAIALLAFSLLIMAVSRAREAGRRAQCMNNQHNLGLALLQSEAQRQYFPGYVAPLGIRPGEKTVTASWVVQVLPHLDRQDLWDQWRSGAGRGVILKMVFCPSDPPPSLDTNSAPLGYVVNCGLPGDADDTPATGVCHNLTLEKPVRVSLNFISMHDGTSGTLLLSENVQAGQWTDTAEADLGMVWCRAPGPYSRINQGKNASDRPHDIQYARPSSNHGGGVVVTFCDGHQHFLREDIDYTVYQHLMTPDSAGAGVPGTLREADF